MCTATLIEPYHLGELRLSLCEIEVCFCSLPRPLAESLAQGCVSQKQLERIRQLRWIVPVYHDAAFISPKIPSNERIGRRMNQDRAAHSEVLPHLTRSCCPYDFRIEGVKCQWEEKNVCLSLNGGHSRDDLMRVVYHRPANALIFTLRLRLVGIYVQL